MHHPTNRPGQHKPGTSAKPASQAAPGQPASEGSVLDRRSGLDRRRAAEALGRQPHASFDADAPTTASTDAGLGSLDQRRGPGRRLSDFTRSAEEGELTSEQFLFVMAIEQFKKSNGRTFPTWTDVLEVVRLLGYRKTCKSDFSLRNAEDWTERADTPSNVRPRGWADRHAA